jgi:hypothetical protein
MIGLDVLYFHVQNRVHRCTGGREGEKEPTHDKKNPKIQKSSIISRLFFLDFSERK